jgi:hypothetical protein
MGIYPFNALALRKRADVLWSTGAFIAICRRRPPFVQYFAMEGYFVELQFDPAKARMLGLTAFTTGERYDRMIEAIELPPLWTE